MQASFKDSLFSCPQAFTKPLEGAAVLLSFSLRHPVEQTLAFCAAQMPLHDCCQKAFFSSFASVTEGKYLCY